MPKTELFIERSVEIVWDYVINQENWYKWWGTTLDEVNPSWQSGAKLVWGNGNKSNLVIVKPQTEFKISSMFMNTTYRFKSINNQKTLIEYEFIPNGGSTFNDGGVAFKTTIDSKLMKLKKCIEAETVINNKAEKRRWWRFERVLFPGVSSFKFPNKCVYCGKRDYKTIKIEKDEMLLIKSEGYPPKQTYMKYLVELQVPYCKEHFFAAQILRIYSIIIFGLGGLLVAVKYYFWFKDYDGDIWPVFLLVGWLFLSALGGVILFFIVNYIFSKVFPIFKAVKVFGMLSLNIEIVDKVKLVLEFYNQIIGHEFEMLNKKK